MCVVFFFFFKQKTAYEMRISDWSSDVCSSDLGEAGVELLGIGAHRRVAVDAARGLHGKAQVFQHQRRREAATVIAISGSLGTDAGDGAIAEIGRASWRERVCQYV